MTERRIRSLGKTNIAKLKQEVFGDKSYNINKIIEHYGLATKSKSYSKAVKQEALEIMRDEYNQAIDAYNTQEKARKTVYKKEQTIKANDKLRQQVTVIDKPNISKLRKELSNYKGESIVVEYLNKKNVLNSIQYDVPNKFSKWWKVKSRDWWVNSEKSIFDKHDEKGKVFIYRQGIPQLNTKKVTQLFREGISNCLFTPIRNWASNILCDAKSKQTKSRYTCIIRNIDELESKYSNGVPEDALNEICNKLQVDINVELPFGAKTTLIEAHSIKKRLKYFKFMNTRLNHVDLNEVVYSDKPIEVTRKELIAIKNQLDEEGTFYTFSKDMQNVSSITTLTHQYKISNDFGKVVNEFEIANGLNFCKIDDMDDHELSQFINSGTNYNGTIDFQDINTSNLKHIDMEKAYSAFQSCWLYEGFLGKVTDFRQTDKVCGVGMYKITDIDFTNCDESFKQIHDKLNIFINNNVYTSPELKLLDHYDVTYKVVCGCWGVKPLNFEFNTDMLELKDEGVRYYSKWAGVCDKHKLKKQFWIKGDSEYFSVIKENCNDGIVKWFENNEGCIEYPKKHNYHLGHITAFITAYQRISVIDQLLEFDYKNLVRVCSDGIYFTGEIVPLQNVFRVKDDINLGNEASFSYVDKSYERELVVEGASFRKHFDKELHLGPGGCGKTHYNCVDKGLIRPMFLAPSWKLSRSKKNELGINCSVWARALCEDPEKISAIKERANVLIIDEVSMLSEGQKLEFFKIYADMKIIMCGDLGYQLPCITGEDMTEKGFDNLMKHETDYRCKDERLKAIKETLRLMICYDRPIKEINNWVIEEFTKLGRKISLEELQEKYSINDMILTGTNETKDFYTKLFEGKNETEKYFMKENNRLYCNGDIIISKEKPDGKCSIQHAFTTHSIQGETAQYNLFIDSSKMFDCRMFYTAVSRAKTLNQIFIVENKQNVFKYEYAKIYKITTTNETYIGSTIHTIDNRFNQHKKAYENYQKGKGKYITSFALMKDENVKIELVENFRCNDLKSLWEREAEIIKTFGIKCVNKTFNEME